MKSSLLQCQAYQIVKGKTEHVNFLDLVILGYPKYKISDDCYIIGNLGMTIDKSNQPIYVVSTQGKSGDDCYDTFLKMYQTLPQVKNAISSISVTKKPIDYTY